MIWNEGWKIRNRKGFFYIEILVAMVIIAAITPPIYLMVMSGYRFSERSMQLVLDLQLAASVTDQVRTLPTELLVDRAWTFAGRETPALELASGPPLSLLTPNREDGQRIRIELTPKAGEPGVRRLIVTVDRPGTGLPPVILGAMVCPN